MTLKFLILRDLGDEARITAGKFIMYSNTKKIYFFAVILWRIRFNFCEKE